MTNIIVFDFPRSSTSWNSKPSIETHVNNVAQNCCFFALCKIGESLPKNPRRALVRTTCALVGRRDAEGEEG